MKEYLIKLAIPIGGLTEVEVRADSPEEAVMELQGMLGDEIVVDSIYNAWEPGQCVWRRPATQHVGDTTQDLGRLRQIWRRMIDGHDDS